MEEISGLYKPNGMYAGHIKLRVTPRAERKIRACIEALPFTEWSGAMYWRYTGAFESHDLDIECADILPMAIGDTVYTEYETNEVVYNYMLENGLEDCCVGLVHSHHVMNTAFSGTDMATCYAEGQMMPHFVSLIVNSKGEYSAAVTRKEMIETTTEMTVSHVMMQKVSGMTEKKTFTSSSKGIGIYELSVTREDASGEMDKDTLGMMTGMADKKCTGTEREREAAERHVKDEVAEEMAYVLFTGNIMAVSYGTFDDEMFRDSVENYESAARRYYKQDYEAYREYVEDMLDYFRDTYDFVEIAALKGIIVKLKESRFKEILLKALEKWE